MTRIHNGEEMVCDDCGMILKSAGEASRHKQERHGEVQPSCSSCKRAYPDEAALKGHIDRNHLDFSCEMCLTHHSSGDSLKAHIAEKHSILSKYSCGACQTVAWGFATAEEHFRAAHARLGYQCDQCGTNLSWDQVNEHMTSDHGEPSQYQCLFQACGSVHISMEELREHVQLHEQGGPRCNPCDEEFETYPGLVNHMSAKHMPCMFSCPTCEKEDINLGLMEKHMLADHIMPVQVVFTSQTHLVIQSSSQGPDGAIITSPSRAHYLTPFNSQVDPPAEDVKKGAASRPGTNDALGCQRCDFVTRAKSLPCRERNLARHVRSAHSNMVTKADWRAAALAAPTSEGEDGNNDTRAGGELVLPPGGVHKRGREGDQDCGDDPKTKAARLPMHDQATEQSSGEIYILTTNTVVAL